MMDAELSLNDVDIEDGEVSKNKFEKNSVHHSKQFE